MTSTPDRGRRRLAAVVLAGGRSTRMGRDKAALDWHGRPLVAHLAATLRALVGDGPVVVAGPWTPAAAQAEGELPSPGRHQRDSTPAGAPPAPPPTWAAALPPATTLLADPHPDGGPLTGLRRALAAVETRADLVLVAATDQPWLTAATFAPLLAAIGDAPAAAWRTPGGPPEPLGAVYRADVDVPDDATAPKHLLRHARLLQADAETAATLCSLDTPEAYGSGLSRA